FGIQEKLDHRNLAHVQQVGFGDPMPTIHQVALRRQNNWIPEISFEDAARMVGNSAAGRWRSWSEPTILVELRNLIDRDLLQRQLPREIPQSFHKPDHAALGCQARVLVCHTLLIRYV